MVPFLAGCGLIFGGRWQHVVATSSPNGAALVTNPATQDYTTPTSLTLERKRTYTLTFSLPGYTSQDVRLERSMRKAVIADLLTVPVFYGVGVLAVLVDGLTGAWYKLSPEVANVTLTKASAGPGPDIIAIAINIRARKTNEEKVVIVSSVPGISVGVRP